MSNRIKLPNFLVPGINSCKSNADIICEFLSFIYKTVNNRSNKKFDFYMLHEITGLPLFVCEKVFTFFQTIQCDGNLYLKEAEFVNGVYGILFGTLENKVIDCFEIFDFDKDGIIHKNDVSLLLYQFHLQNNTDHKIGLLDKVVNDFFINNNEGMNKEEFISKCQKDNCDIALLLIVFMKEFGSFFSEKEVNFYSKLCSKKQSKLLLAPSQHESIKNSKVYHPTKALLDYLDNIELKISKNENEFENSLSYIESVNEDNSDGDSALSDEEPLLELHNFELDLQQAIQTSFNESKNVDICSVNIMKSESFINTKEDFRNKTKGSDNTQWLSTSVMTNSISYSRDNTLMSMNGINTTTITTKHCNPLSKQESILKQNELICYKIKDNVPQIKYKLKIIGKFLFFFRSVNESFTFTKMLPISALFCKVTNYSKEKIYFSLYSTMHHQINNVDFLALNKNHWDTFISIFRTKNNKQRIIDHFEIKKVLGKGKFGRIFLAQNKSNHCFYAIKEIEKASKEEEYKVSKWEYAITKLLINLNHDNIIKGYSIYESVHKLYFVYEYIEGKDLREEFKQERNIQNIYKTIHELFNGIEFLHKYGIVHRDLKITNVLMMNNQNQNMKVPKIIDFGLSRIISVKDKSTDPYGSLCFQSPEVLLNIPHNSKVDIWAMGIIIFYLLYNELPFGDKSKKHIREFIIQDRIPFIVEQHDYVSVSNNLSINNDNILIERKLRLLIKVCLEHNIRSRSSAQMILQQFFYVNN